MVSETETLNNEMKMSDFNLIPRLWEAKKEYENMTPKKVKCFLGGPEEYQKSVFAEAKMHISVPAMNYVRERIDARVSDRKLNTIVAPPGSGKTHVYTYDLFWEMMVELVRYHGNGNMINVFTSPDCTVNEAVIADLKVVKEWTYENPSVWNPFLVAGIRDINVVSHPSDLNGYGTEILVCTPKMIAEDGPGRSSFKKAISNSFLGSIISDEAHRGLGCPSSETYREDVGHTNHTYNAVWFHGLRDLNPFIWIGLTGTPTKSQESDSEYYNVISDKMTKSTFRNGFVADLDMSETYTLVDIVVDIFEKCVKLNAINKYRFNKLENDLPEGRRLFLEKNRKVTSFFRAGQNGRNGNPSRWGTAEDVERLWSELVEKYRGSEFEYFDKITKETVTLVMEPGKCAVCLSENKTDDMDNNEIFNLLNDPNSGYDALAALHIGTVGVNIKNLGFVGIIAEIDNDGDVDNSPRQLIGRLARCHFVWPGAGWSHWVAKLGRESREYAIELAIGMSTKVVKARYSNLVKSAFESFKEGHIELAGAYTYLSELVNTSIRLSTNLRLSTERNKFYQQFKKEHCEFCETHNDSGLPMCEHTAREQHPDMTEEEFKKYWKGCLDVHHKNGNRNDDRPENLITLCKNEHGFTTMENEDYLNRY